MENKKERMQYMVQGEEEKDSSRNGVDVFGGSLLCCKSNNKRASSKKKASFV